MTASIFLFAHQDDECGVFQAISSELECGNSVYCLYFTSGVRKGGDSDRRDDESKEVLTSLGVDLNNIYFFGSQSYIPDCKLVDCLNVSYEFIIHFLSKIKENVKIYIPSWEGGHPDHDALHLIGVIAAKNSNLLQDTFQYSLYNGYFCFGPLFRTLSPLIKNGKVISSKIPLKNRLKFLGLCLKYPSQRKTWIGLFPFFLLHYLIWGNQNLQTVSVERLRYRPHFGSLYYERRNFSTWEKLFPKFNAFLRDKLP